ncbi:Gag/polymerase/env Polyprotein [Phytophthora palmivora]|uniref:Gag/polymerase/env Polyprotein n=1 Tax=Phytophthora palmivora TaxID=4796 RepID=A0A2P4YIZ1_9STRA|nr:Gag/polymerase/env Polyprotein [Phytophthora palmivora]
MRKSDIPLTAVSTPSVMLLEWLVMPQGLSNNPATFNRLVTQLFRPLRTFAQTYFDDIFVHSRADGGQTAMEVHLKHLRRVLEVMRANKLYVNIDKCVFAAEEINVLGSFVSRVGVRADPGKVKTIAVWPTPRSQKDLRKWLGLANYLHKNSAGYAELARPLSNLLKKDTDWVWEHQHQDAFDSIKARLRHAPVLALPDETTTFSVVCDAPDYAIGCALLQKDDEGHERVISFQSRQQKAAERNYPVHDKELLAMNGWRGGCHFFAEYNFRVEYKPGKLNVLSDALSRRPDYELAHVSRVTTDLYDQIRLAYQEDENYTPLSTGFRLKVTEKQVAQLFLDSVFRNHGIPETIVSDKDPRFMGAFWDSLFQLFRTKLTKPTADHPQTDDQTEPVNRVLEDTLHSICAEAPRSWSYQLPMVEFALNNAVHASTGFTSFLWLILHSTIRYTHQRFFTPFYLNGLRHPQVPLTLRGGAVASIMASIISGGEARKALSSLVSDIEPESLKDSCRRL